MRLVFVKFKDGGTKRIEKVWFTTSGDTCFVVKTHGDSVFHIPWSAISYAEEYEDPYAQQES